MKTKVRTHLRKTKKRVSIVRKHDRKLDPRLKNITNKQYRTSMKKLAPFADADKDGIKNWNDKKPFDKNNKTKIKKNYGGGLGIGDPAKRRRDSWRLPGLPTLYKGSVHRTRPLSAAERERIKRGLYKPQESQRQILKEKRKDADMIRTGGVMITRHARFGGKKRNIFKSDIQTPTQSKSEYLSKLKGVTLEPTKERIIKKGSGIMKPITDQGEVDRTLASMGLKKSKSDD